MVCGCWWWCQSGCVSIHPLCMRLDCIGSDAVEIVLAVVVKGRMVKRKEKEKKKKKKRSDSTIHNYGTVLYLSHGCNRKSNK